MKILITGATGFLGKILKNQLQQTNDIFTLARNKSDYKVNLQENFSSFEQYFDIVIHAAGKAHQVPKTQSASEEFFTINFNGTQNLLNSLDQKKPRSFIYISSVGVYGLETGCNISENQPLKACDPYGKSKIQAEQLVLDWCIKNNVVCTILRLPLIVGPNPPGNLGSMIRGIKDGYYFNIAGGVARKSMVLATDVAKFILKASEIGGIYNLSDGYHPNFQELSLNIANQLNKPTPKNLPMGISKILAKIGDLFGEISPINSRNFKKITSDLTFDDSKARLAFGWDPTPVLKGFNLDE